MQNKPKGLDADWVRYLLKYMGGANVRIYRATGGRVLGNLRVPPTFKPVPLLLLDHVGRKSGKAFTTPLVYLRDGDDLVVVASQGGRPTNPAWFYNLMATPETTVQIKRDVLAMRARRASAEEKARIWPKLVEMYADFDSYASWTDRDIPVVILEPRA